MEGDGHHEYCAAGFDPEDIVVSGMSGRFPECNSVQELKDALLAKENLIVFKKLRYAKGAGGVPYDSCGSIPDAEKLDANFFSIPAAVASILSPGQRKHLEVVYEAISDAGYEASELRGTRVGVYNACISEDDMFISQYQDDGMVNGLRSIHSNRVSYHFDFLGPSYSVDSACSGSATALHVALNDLREGRVSSALVTGVQLNLSPLFHAFYFNLNICTTTGNSIPFDATSDGLIRAETIAAIFLQKAKHARRAYGTVMACSFWAAGYSVEGMLLPNRNKECETMKMTLREAGVDPDDVDYVEAHGTGTLAGDPIELNSLADAFQVDSRKKPLYVGSIKSNIGHTEASSGICGYVKALLSLEMEQILPNCRFNEPTPGCPALLEGKLNVPTETLPLTSRYLPVNSFGLGGTLSTAVFKQNPRTYQDAKTQLPLPRMVLFPGTTEEAVTSVFEHVRQNPDLPNEFFALLNKLAFCPPVMKPIRGFAIYQDPQNPAVQIKKFDDAKKRPVWFIMTGMGSQWPGMGLQLMGVEVFAKSMRRSAAAAKAFGLDLFEIIRADRDYFNMQRNITPTFVGLAAIQMAQIDLLRQLGVEPDGIIGHSAGELLCTYADGCCTQEEVIACAYWRGKSVDISDLPEGAMAAVGLSWEEAKRRCPEGVYPACDNADDSVTVSGPNHLLEAFVSELRSEGVFGKTVNTAGYAFHSKYIHDAGAVMLRELKKIIKSPRPRSKRWVSTCYREDEYETEECRHFSADYFVHNLLNEVLFNDAVKKVPKDAVTIEIGPHFLLQSILKRTIGPAASYVGLMKRNDPDNVRFLLESIGKLYNEGVDPKIERLYPPVQFPVPRATPMISNLIKWDHSQDYDVPVWRPRTNQFNREVKVNREESYILHHQIDGRSLFPATGYAVLAWEALAAKGDRNMLEVPVVIENFKILRATILNPNSPPKFCVNILDSSGNFEVTEGNALVATGLVHEPKQMVFSEEEPKEYAGDETAVSGKDLYNELKMSGYEYGPAFQNLVEISMDGSDALVSWTGKWIPFLDTLLLFFGLLQSNQDFVLPTGALYFKIDPTVMQKIEKEKDEQAEAASQSVSVHYNPSTNVCRAPGVEICKLHCDTAPRRGKRAKPTLEEYTFVPNDRSHNFHEEEERDLTRYMAECNRLIDKIGKETRKDFKVYRFVVEDLVEEDTILEIKRREDKKPEAQTTEDTKENEAEVEVPKDPKRVVLDTLKAISESGIRKAGEKKEIFEAFARDVGGDALNSVLLNEDNLRALLELVLENSYRKVSALEVSHDFPFVLPQVVDILKKYSHSKIKTRSLVTSKQLSEEEKASMAENEITVLEPDSMPTFVDRPRELIIGSFTHGSRSELQERVRTLATVVASNGFVLFFHKEGTMPIEKLIGDLLGSKLQIQPGSALEKVMQEERLEVLSKISDGFGVSMYLLRPAVEQGAKVVLQVPEDGAYRWVEDLKKSLADPESGKIWLVSENSDVSGIVGMVNCLKQEPGGERIRCVFMYECDDDSGAPPFNFDHPFYSHLLKKDLVMNVFKDEAWGTFRHFLIRDSRPKGEVDHSILNCRKLGDLSSFEWYESQIPFHDPADPPRLCHVYYAPLNFKDVMLATGKINLGADEEFGREFAGRDETGRRVAGFMNKGGLATTVLLHEEAIFEVPDTWTLEEASTIPTVYMTCYYALLERAGLREGESILIHSGTGGIGQAAINIALSLDCEIFTTVGNQEKREYIMKKFPQINPKNIGNSRNITFETMIMNRTKGKGVDVVLNSLADDKLQASLRCVAMHGRFVEIGKYDLQLDRPMGLKIFLKNLSYHSVHVDMLLDGATRARERKLLEDIMRRMRQDIREGVVKPLDRTVFSTDQVEEAFRFMAKGLHMGKIIIKIRDEEKDRLAIPRPLRLRATRRTHFYPHKTYVVVGGLGGFGVELTKWILRKGGKHVVLTSRFGERVPYHYLCLNRWEKEGCDVRVSTLNVARRAEAEQLLREVMEIGPIGGIFNSAVVLKDAFIDQQSASTYEEVCAPKAAATRHLDELTRQLCPSLDFFVCFSSISCGRGNAGQSNYGYANSVMERVCELRRSVGLHGLSIQWGIIGDVGVVHRHMGDDAMIAGVTAQPVASCLRCIDAFLTMSVPVVSSYVTAVATKKSQGDVLALISKVLGVSSIDAISTTRSFGEMGIDSMVGVELKQLLESTCDTTLTMQEIQELKIDDVRAMLEKAESEKTSSAARPALVSTISLKLPEVLLHQHTLLRLNKESSGTPLVVLNVGDNELEKELGTLAQLAKRPLCMLHWTQDTPADSLRGAAEYFLAAIETELEGRPFQLVGHGFGSGLALEMARLSSHVTSLALLDGSSDVIRGILREEEATDVTALCRFFAQFVPEGSAKLEDDLKRTSSLDQRIKALLDFVTSSCSGSVNRQELQEAVQLHMRKADILLLAPPPPEEEEVKVVAKDVVLIENPALVLPNDISEIIANFAQVCSGKVTVHRAFMPSEISNKDEAQQLCSILDSML